MVSLAGFGFAARNKFFKKSHCMWLEIADQLNLLQSSGYLSVWSLYGNKTKWAFSQGFA